MIDVEGNSVVVEASHPTSQERNHLSLDARACVCERERGGGRESENESEGGKEVEREIERHKEKVWRYNEMHRQSFRQTRDSECQTHK